MKRLLPCGLAASLVFALCSVAFNSTGMSEELRVSRHTTKFTEPPRRVPSNTITDAPLTGNGDIGIVMAGPAHNLTFYIGKNDFWHAWPTYPDAGYKLAGGLTIGIPDLEGATYEVETVFDQSYIKGRFTKDDLTVEMKAWVAAT